MKTQKEAEDEFVATLTAADSSAVLTLCTQCMDLLKAKETDKALDMLYSIDERYSNGKHWPNVSSVSR